MEEVKIILDDNKLLDRCFGCFYGALTGDAIGAFLEFKKDIKLKDVEEALTLPGGGLHKIGPGEITDDGELSISLARGLAEGQGQLNLNLIASCFGEWFESRPFDIGNTLRNSIPKAVKLKEHQAEMIRRGSSNNKKSQTSQSNGSLMMLTPFCLWVRNLSEDEIFLAATELTIMTHPNIMCHYSNTFYAIIVKYLLCGKSNQKAFEKAKLWAQQSTNQEFKEWINDIEKKQLPPPTKASGWVKVALSYAINYLLLNVNYENAIKDMLLQGGDTDTNCCIIGGLLGCAYGLSSIPEKLYKTVLEWTPYKGGYKRPQFLIPKYQAEKLLKQIVEIAPKKPGDLIIIGSQKEYIKQQDKK